MITRRCTQRQFLLRPDPATNDAFVYCLAVAALRTGVRVLFTAAQSNHHHTGIFDPLGTYPDFIEHFHKLLAKCMNALRGRWENFWSSEQTSVVRLVDAPDVLDKMVYALTNPVKDHLVAKVADWPGVNAFESIMSGGSISAVRPDFFFREDGPMPASATLTFVRPPEFADMAADQFAGMLRARVEALKPMPRPGGVRLVSAFSAGKPFSTRTGVAARAAPSLAGSFALGWRRRTSGAASRLCGGTRNSATSIARLSGRFARA
jgi:putative transposase